jgi:hypothetical protein
LRLASGEYGLGGGVARGEMSLAAVRVDYQNYQEGVQCEGKGGRHVSPTSSDFPRHILPEPRAPHNMGTGRGAPANDVPRGIGLVACVKKIGGRRKSRGRGVVAFCNAL